MNNTILVVLIILGISSLAFLMTHYLLEWSWKKSLIIAGSAGVAMIIFDVISAKKKFIDRN